METGNYPPRGSGTDRFRQIFRERYLPTSVWRGTASLRRVYGFHHTEWSLPSR